jgi:hypothetical protein
MIFLSSYCAPVFESIEKKEEGGGGDDDDEHSCCISPWNYFFQIE